MLVKELHRVTTLKSVDKDGHVEGMTIVEFTGTFCSTMGITMSDEEEEVRRCRSPVTTPELNARPLPALETTMSVMHRFQTLLSLSTCAATTRRRRGRPPATTPTTRWTPSMTTWSFTAPTTSTATRRAITHSPPAQNTR